MDEVIAVLRFRDMSTHRMIHLPSRNRLVSGDGVLRRLHAKVASLAHNFENFALPIRRSLPHDSHPRNVVIHRARRIFLRPYVDQNKIAFPNRHRTAGARLVMRIAAIGIHRDNRRIVRNHVLSRKRLHEKLLDLMFVRSPAAHPPSNFLESLGSNGIDHIARRKVRLDLLIRQCRFKLRNQVAALTIFLPSPRIMSAVPASTIEIVKTKLFRRVLHRHIAMRSQNLLQASNSSCHPAYCFFTPGKVSRCPDSILCTSLMGSPLAGSGNTSAA